MTGAAWQAERADGAIVVGRRSYLLYATDAPGARVALTTDAEQLTFLVEHLPRPAGLARSSSWAILVDGDVTAVVAGRQAPGPLAVPVELADRGTSEVALLAPYGDRVALLGVDVPADASVAPPATQDSPLLVALGDSVTQGFWASGPHATWVEQVRHRLGWRAVNLGFAGHVVRAQEAGLLDEHDPDVVTVAFGINDCLQQRPVDDFRHELRGLVDGVHRRAPRARIILLTPTPQTSALWPQLTSLPDFRDAVRQVAAERGTLCVEGPELLPAAELPDLTVDDRLHPSDSGFTVMAERLVAAVIQDDATPARASTSWAGRSGVDGRTTSF